MKKWILLILLLIPFTAYGAVVFNAPLNGDMTDSVGNADTFTRYTSGTYIDSSGVLQTAEADEDRYEYPTDTDAWLLVEPQSTNMVPYSEDFENGWVEFDNGDTYTLVADPAGGTTATAITPDSTNGGHGFYTTILEGDVTSTGSSFSLFVKDGAGSKNWVAISMSDEGGTLETSYFNLSTGTIGVGDDLDLVVDSLGNGWYRISGNDDLTNGSGNDPGLRIYVAEDSGDATIAGDGSTVELIIWGAQLEELPVPTSYIPTDGYETAVEDETLLGLTTNQTPTAADFTSKGVAGISFADSQSFARIQDFDGGGTTTEALGSDMFDAQTLGAELYTWANNAVSDGGTEANATTGWGSNLSTMTSSSTIYSTGSYSLLCQMTDNGWCTEQLGTGMTLGKSYQLTFAARHTGTGGNVVVGIDDGTTTMAGSNDVTLTSADTTFTTYTFYFVYSASEDWLVIDDNGNGGTGGVYIDNLTIKEVTAPAKGEFDEPQILGSEVNTEEDASSPAGVTEANDTSFWNNTGMTTFESSSTQAYSGTYSVHVVADDNNDYITTDTMTVAANTLHKVSFWYYLVASDADTYGIYRMGYPADSDGYVVDTDMKASAGTWTEIVEYVYTGAETELLVRVYEGGGGNDAEIYLDQISVRPVQISWVPEGTNTLSISNDALVITYVDDDDGADLYFADTKDLSSDLTVGNRYKLVYDITSSLDALVDLKVSGPGGFAVELNNQDFTSGPVTVTLYFTADHATNMYMRFNNFTSGTLTIDNLTIQNVTNPMIANFSNKATSDEEKYRITLEDDDSKFAYGWIGEQDAAEALGLEEITNGAFANWTGDDPDDWVISAEDAGNYITENPAGSAQIVSDGSAISMTQTLALEGGKLYKTTFDVDTVASGSIKVEVDGWTACTYNSTGSKECYWTAAEDNITFRIMRNAACDITIDDVVTKEVTSAGIDSVHIYPERYATTTGWTSIDSGFDYNNITAVDIEEPDGGFAVARAKDVPTWATSAGMNTAFDQDGTFFCQIRPGASQASYTINEGFVSLRGSQSASLIYMNSGFRTYDGTGAATAGNGFVRGTTYNIPIRWTDDGATEMSIYVNGKKGTTTFDGAYVLSGGDVTLGVSQTMPFHIRNLKMWNTTLTESTQEMDGATNYTNTVYDGGGETIYGINVGAGDTGGITNCSFMGYLGAGVVSAVNVAIINSAFYNPLGSDITATANTATLTNCVLHRAEAYGELSGTITDAGGSQFSTNPGFRDYVSGQARLKASSPCINAGSTSGTTTDIRGRARGGSPDVGAYESKRVIPPWLLGTNDIRLLFSP